MIANSVSRIGTPRITTGMRIGAKKKNELPEKLRSVRPPTTIVDAAISRPSSRAPPSPMKMRAGWMLWGRKPRQAPSVTTAISAPMLPGASSPSLPSSMEYRKNAPAAMATRPSRPSMRLMALAIPTTHSTDSRYDQSLDSTNTPRNGTRNTSIETPEITRMLAASTMPAIFAGAETSRRSSITPTATITMAASTRPSGSVLPSKIWSKAPIAQATPMPTSSPTSMPIPPRVAVGRLWTRRSSGLTTAPRRNARRRTRNMDAKVTTVTTARTTP